MRQYCRVKIKIGDKVRYYRLIGTVVGEDLTRNYDHWIIEVEGVKMLVQKNATYKYDCSNSDY